MKWLCLTGLLLGIGCAGGPGRGSGGIDEVQLFGIPMMLDLDGQRGADGFAVRVYAVAAGRAKGVPIRRGTFEVLMFDGVVRGQDLYTKPPHRLWKFTTAELPAHAAATSLGEGYRFILRWEENKPTRDHITVIARYVPPKGPPIYSSPNTIAAAIK